MSFISKLDDGPIAKTAKNKIIQLRALTVTHSSSLLTLLAVYNDLTHPAATYVGPTHAFRAADGSGNNPDVPDMGKVRRNPLSLGTRRAHNLCRLAHPTLGLSNRATHGRGISSQIQVSFSIRECLTHQRQIELDVLKGSRL